jgi:ribosomal protein S18 acetylase RimI-like enzyme
VTPPRPIPDFRVVRVQAAAAARVAREAEPLFDEPADLAALNRYLSDRRNVFFVAYAGRTVVGFLRGTGLDQIHTRRPQMFLYEVSVSPSYRRKGVGRALVERLLEYCRDRGFEEAFVFTDPSNRPAVELYRSTGAITETPRDRMFVYRLPGEPTPRPRRVVPKGTSLAQKRRGR